MPTSLTIELLAARAHSHTRLRQLLADRAAILDRKSTRLNSSHGYISYAVFCLKKKNIHDFRPSCRGCRLHASALRQRAPGTHGPLPRVGACATLRII